MGRYELRRLIIISRPIRQNNDDVKVRKTKQLMKKQILLLKNHPWKLPYKQRAQLMDSHPELAGDNRILVHGLGRIKEKQ